MKQRNPITKLTEGFLPKNYNKKNSLLSEISENVGEFVTQGKELVENIGAKTKDTIKTCKKVVDTTIETAIIVTQAPDVVVEGALLAIDDIISKIPREKISGEELTTSELHSLLLSKGMYDASLVRLMLTKGRSGSSELSRIIDLSTNLTIQQKYKFALCIPDLMELSKERHSCATIKEIYEKTPKSICQLIVAIQNSSGWPGKDDFHDEDQKDILRYYIKQSAESFTVSDIVLSIIKLILDRFSNLSTGYVPSAQTIYLVMVWTKMLYILYEKDNAKQSLDKLVRVSIAILVAGVQYANRETPLHYIKDTYASTATVHNFIQKLPDDIKRQIQIVVDEFIKNNTIKTIPRKNLNNNQYDYYTYILNFVLGWNGDLSILTEIDNLSMFKAINMVYTYRIGIIYADLPEHSQSKSIESFMDLISKYGPLPSPEQIGGILKLYQEDTYAYNRRLKAIKQNTINRLGNNSSYEIVLKEMGDLYRENLRLNIAYWPQYTFTIYDDNSRELMYDHVMVNMLCGWIKDHTSYSCLNSISKDQFANDTTKYILSNYNELCIPQLLNHSLI